MAWIDYNKKKPKPNRNLVVIVFDKLDDSVKYEIVSSSAITKDGKVITRYHRLQTKVLFWIYLPKEP